MAVKYKKRAQQHSHSRPARPGPKPIPLDPARVESEVRQLLASGKLPKALEMARGHYRRTGAAEGLLQEAYQARLEALLVAGESGGCEELLAQALSEHPGWESFLQGWTLRLAARRGEWDRLLEPLACPDLALELRQRLEELIRCEMVDLASLANTPVLPGDHPLKTAAASLLQAFQAVTSGPAQPALPELSRRSPLAPWRLLVQAISCFYREQDQAAERFLQSIPAGSAPARLVPSLRSAMQGGQDAFGDRLAGGQAGFKAALTQLDQAVNGEPKARRNTGAVLDMVGKVVQWARQSCPERVEQLRLQIWLRCARLGTDQLSRALGGPLLRDAFFWQMLACQAQTAEDQPLTIAAYWEEFRQQARAQGQLDPCHESVLLLHMAGYLRGSKKASPKLVHILREHYQGQPAPIRAASALGSGKRLGPEWLDLQKMYQRACSLDPRPEAFSQWLKWERERDQGQPEQAAESWHLFHPTDVRPLLELVELAEQKDAFRPGQKWLKKAQELDCLDPRLTRAQMRLGVRACLYHLRAKKPHLARADLVLLDSLPLMGREERPALLGALRCLEALASGRAAELPQLLSRVQARLQSGPAATVLVSSLAHHCKLRSSWGPCPAGRPELVALVRLGALTEEFGLELMIPEPWEQALRAVLPGAALSDEALAALAQEALDCEMLELAFEATGQGLGRAPACQARCLFVRAQTLGGGSRARSCLAAASELARQQHDQALVSQIAEFAEGLQPPVSSQELAFILARERQAQSLPEPEWLEDVEDKDDPEECSCPECRRRRQAEDLAFFELLQAAAAEAGKKKRRS